MPQEKIHFIGAAGAGVSAVAQFHVMGGGLATGSDRSFDRGGSREVRKKLEALGLRFFPQDGSGVDKGLSRVVISAAVEESNADIKKAESLGIPVVHRADCLAEYVAANRTIAVAGTSGKSTVVAMIFEILRSAGLNPSVITGGPLIALQKEGLLGNAFRGKSDLLVIEADESDGTLVRYKPKIGVLLNISKDHKETAELRKMFETFRGHSAEFAVQTGFPEFQALESGSLTFGIGSGSVRAESLELGGSGSTFSVSKVRVRLPAAGRHNVENALAAIAACSKAGVSLEAAAKGLERFDGVARRLQSIGAASGIEVIDDFAHNPVKVKAAMDAVHLKFKRIHAVFQLHGYAPAKFLKNEFIDSFGAALGKSDTLWLPEIYYAGGTADKTISAEEIAKAVAQRGKSAKFYPQREAIIPEIVASAKPGDAILVMGARDPSLSEFARAILEAVKSK